MNVLIDWAKNLTFFMIFMNLAYQLMPEGKLQRYGKLLGSFLLLLLLLEPIMGFFSLEEELNHMVSQAQKEMEDEMRQNWQDGTIQKKVLQRKLESEITYLLGEGECEAEKFDWEWEENEGEWSVCAVSIFLQVQEEIWQENQENWSAQIAQICGIEEEKIEYVIK